MNSLSDRLTRLRERLGIEGPALAHPVLDSPQFTNEDVLAVTGLSATQLHNWVSRGWVTIRHQSPGKGRRRLFCGADVLAIELAAALAPFGMVQIADQLVRFDRLAIRAKMMLDGAPIAEERPLFILFAGDDWLYVWPEAPLPECDTDAFLALSQDELIVRTLERLAYVVDGEAVPPKRLLKVPTADETQNQIDEFFGTWSEDEQGRKVATGLTFEETAEFFDLQPRYRSGSLSREERQRYYALSEKHTEAAHRKANGAK